MSENKNMNKEFQARTTDDSSTNADDNSVSLTCPKPNVGSSAYYLATPNLRYAKRVIVIDEQTVKHELRLQQMWQGSDGSQKWEWVEEWLG